MIQFRVDYKYQGAKGYSVGGTFMSRAKAEGLVQHMKRMMPLDDAKVIEVKYKTRGKKHDFIRRMLDDDGMEANFNFEV